MKIIDYFIKENPELAKEWHGRKGIIETVCPIEAGIEELECDINTAICDNRLRWDGSYHYSNCRGTTCEKCWNQEIELFDIK
ncbi:MAG: hypothetical protein ACRCSY_09100 [Cetobacterium sp.]